MTEKHCKQQTIEFKRNNRYSIIFSVIAWVVFSFVILFIARFWFIWGLGSMLLIIAILADSKAKIRIYDDRVTQSTYIGIGNVQFLWKDIKEIEFKKYPLIGINMRIVCPYERYVQSENGLSDILINIFFRNYKELWKEVVLRSVEDNPNVEIAEEFRAMFL